MSTLRSDNLVSRSGNSAPNFPKGAVIAGVATATSFAGNVIGDLTGNVTGNISGGTVAGSTLTGTLQTGSQPNITTVGTLSTLNVADQITAGSASFSGNISIGGTLTYSDVTNVDSVGLITAKNGLHVTAGVSTFAGALDVNNNVDVSGYVDVDGQTTLDDLNVSGVSTFTGTIDANGLIDAGEGVFIPDTKEIKIGNTAASPDLKLYHNGSNTYIENGTGNLMITGNNTDKIHIRAHASKQEIVCFPGAGVQLFHNDTKTFETTNLGAKVTGDLEITGVTTASSYSGRHAEVPKNAKSGAYTLLKTDSGQCISTNSAVTVPNAVFASGDAITVFNDSSSAIALTQGSGLQLRKAGTTTTGSLSIKEFGLVTIWFNTGGTAIASGNLA